MIIKIPKIFNVIRTSVAQKFVHQYLLKMDKAYLRRVNESEQFEIAFKYVDSELRINRQFNFNRRLSETVESFLSRVGTNVEKVVSKKSRKKKKKNNIKEEELVTEESVEDKKTDVSLFVDNREVARDTICSDVFLPGKNIVLKLDSVNYEVIVNSPWIETISLPSSMLATFPVSPSKFETMFTEKELSTFNWSKSADKKNWTDISNDFICIPSNEEIGHHLKLSCTPRNSSFEGPCIESISECTVEASPGRCPFDNRHEFTKERATGNE